VTHRAGVGVLAVIAALAAPRVAHACGSSGPDGVSACSLADYEEAQRPRWRVGVSGVYTSTFIRFSDTLIPGETRYAALAEVTYAPTSRFTLSAGLGAAVYGKLNAPDGPHDFGPGVVASVGASYRFLEGATPVGRGFVVGSALVSFTGSSTQLGDSGPTTAYDALDFRVGAAAGLRGRAAVRRTCLLELSRRRGARDRHASLPARRRAGGVGLPARRPVRRGGAAGGAGGRCGRVSSVLERHVLLYRATGPSYIAMQKLAFGFVHDSIV